MNSFFKTVFACLVAIALFIGGAGVFGLMMLAGLAALGDKPVNVPDDAVLVLDLATGIVDAPPQANVDPSTLFGGEPSVVTLRDALLAIEAAKSDERIRGIHITGNALGVPGSGMATLQEVRAALEDFRASGKPVSAHFTYITNRDYYLASVANEVTLQPAGVFAVGGLAAEGLFFKGLFDRLGIDVEVVNTGAYKTAADSFRNERFSEADREQIGELFEDMWGVYVADVARSRGLEPAAFQDLVDTGSAFDAGSAVRERLVDRVRSNDDMLGVLRELTKTAEGDDIPQITLGDYARAVRLANRSNADNEVAVVYAEGVIVDGEGAAGEIGGASLGRLIRSLGDEDDIKAIVLRVNSPGGSAWASDEVVESIRRVRESGRTIVVSMGTVAASGGYYISMGADRIFAQASTITGSIGVVGMLPNVSRMADEYGVNADVIKTGELADMGSLFRPMSTYERQLFQDSVDVFYERFLHVVGTNRNLERDAVHALAQGRVWSGADALEHGLVDELGGLDAAIQFAAERAGLGEDYVVAEYPKERPLAEAIAELLEQGGSRPLAQDPVSRLTRTFEAEVAGLRQLNDRGHVYLRLPFDIELR